MTAATLENQRRFQTLVSVFDLSLEEVSKVVGLSRSLLSRTLHGHRGITHEAVYARLEKCLPEIIAKRGKAFFEVQAIPVELAEQLRTAGRPPPQVAAQSSCILI